MTVLSLADTLRNNHLKATPQRLAIYGYLVGTKTHPTVEEIYEVLKGDYPKMSLATVYKTVASLRDSGLVNELNAGDGSCRYDANIKPHAHIVCRKCHKVGDYDGEVISSDVRKNINAMTGFLTESEFVYFFGVCAECGKH